MIIQKKHGKSAVLAVFSRFERFFTIFAGSEWRENGKIGKINNLKLQTANLKLAVSLEATRFIFGPAGVEITWINTQILTGNVDI